MVLYALLGAPTYYMTFSVLYPLRTHNLCSLLLLCIVIFTLLNESATVSQRDLIIISMMMKMQ